MKIKEMNSFLKFILPSGVIAITLAPFGIYIKKYYLKNTETINHEKIHLKQQIEMLIIFFYIWYILEWLIKLIIFTVRKSKVKYESLSELNRIVYLNISFEKEAHENDKNLNYLNERKFYSWIKYIFK